jgi:hypothetical protein
VNALVVLLSVTSIALVLRVVGVFREFLPDIGTLAALLAALHLLRLAKSRAWRAGEWRDVLHTHAFGIGLFAVCVFSLLVRLPNFAADLGHTPLDIDERRVAGERTAILRNWRAAPRAYRTLSGCRVLGFRSLVASEFSSRSGQRSRERRM